MKRAVVVCFLVMPLAALADSWIHSSATVTGLNVTTDRLVIYYRGGQGACGGNGEFPFFVNRAEVGNEAYRAMQSAAMLAYATNKLISVHGSLCENVKQLRVHEPNAYFGNNNP